MFIWFFGMYITAVLPAQQRSRAAAGVNAIFPGWVQPGWGERCLVTRSLGASAAGSYLYDTLRQ